MDSIFINSKCKMKLLKPFFLVLLFFSVSTFTLRSQKKIQINIAPLLSYRGYILELTDYPVRYSNPGYTSEFYKQFGLRSIGVDFNTDLINGRMSVLLSSYFRYGYLYYDKTLNKEVAAFKADLFADCVYNFGIKRNRKYKFFAGLGVGKVNIGTGFKYAFIPAIDSSGNQYLKESVGTFSFNSARVLVGVKKGRWAITINVMGTPDEDRRPNFSGTLEGKIAYSIMAFKIPVSK
jgi:hypothetical protein